MTNQTQKVAAKATGQPGFVNFEMALGRFIGCCGPAEQAGCCAPQSKAQCCGGADSKSCGCR